MFQTVHLECHQQRSPRPHFGSLQRSPDPLAGLRGPTSKERGGEGRRGEGREGRRWTLDPHNVGDRLAPAVGLNS